MSCPSRGRACAASRVERHGSRTCVKPSSGRRRPRPLRARSRNGARGPSQSRAADRRALDHVGRRGGHSLRRVVRGEAFHRERSDRLARALGLGLATGAVLSRPASGSTGAATSHISRKGSRGWAWASATCRSSPATLTTISSGRRRVRAHVHRHRGRHRRGRGDRAPGDGRPRPPGRAAHPVLLARAEPNERGLLGYLVVLDLLVLAIARFRTWRGLNRLAWAGTVLLLAPMLTRQPESDYPVARLVLLSAALPALSPHAARPRVEPERARTRKWISSSWRAPPPATSGRCT